ncbi:MAG TPA: type II toxin-antitoxin system HipA family toxin [Pseudomonadaceae bacterium]|nr:type II toxin-antitoxin system HipA family toxin [Pseudomonadaceae bacterium]
MSLAEVRLWGRRIGAVRWDSQRSLGWFEYDAPFLASGVQLAPLSMPLAPGIHGFPALAGSSFQGLPGLLADSLPGDFGDALINTWLEREGRAPESFNPVDRLCCIGSRGRGALEYLPVTGPCADEPVLLDLATLLALASDILRRRNAVQSSFAFHEGNEELAELLRVGIPTWGAAAGAVVAWHAKSGELRCGDLAPPADFSCWLLKFSGVSGNGEHEAAAASAQLEFAASLMARKAGIHVEECRLLEESGRHHFMSRRSDRNPEGGKLHLQTLAALTHGDDRQAQGGSWEQALGVVRQLGLGMDALEELFRRMAFSIVAHTRENQMKSIAFLMDRSGRWSLAPASGLGSGYTNFDTPGGAKGGQPMSLNGKRDGFLRDDFRHCARQLAMKRGRAERILDEVREAVLSWPACAREAGVPERDVRRIAKMQRLQFPG